MAETVDDLSAPLGQKTARQKRRFRLPFTAMQALAVLLGLVLTAFAGFALFNNNPLGGEPVAIVNPANPNEAVIAVEHLIPAENRGEFLLFDGFSLRPGPIARLPLKHLIHPGFHTSLPSSRNGSSV